MSLILIINLEMATNIKKIIVIISPVMIKKFVHYESK